MKTILLFLSVLSSTALFGQNVYIPDATFKLLLIGNTSVNTNLDTEIQVSEATAFDDFIYVPSAGISDMTGIEAFTAITGLDCQFNQLTSLDVSQNVALEFLNCWGNQLTSLDVSQNTALETLYCHSNQLTSLDVSQNTALTDLDCGGHPFTILDISQNTALETLWCTDNQLTSLDVSQNTALENLNCGDNQLTSLDISQNTALTYLNCNINQLTSLDVSQNTALTFLQCQDNHLTSLDVSQNTALTDLDCQGNQLTSLDVSQNVNLLGIQCYDNQLTCLNVANGNNLDITLTADNNPDLTCIEVDNYIWATANWQGQVHPEASFSQDCNNDCSSSTVGINELSTSKNLIQILDLMGRETSFKPNTPLIYVCDDGSIEKVFSVEY